MNDTRSVPWHLWVVGILGLLFTLFGAYDYTMSQMGNREYIAAAVAPMGVDADTAVAYFSGFPLWADFVWALGVWGAVAGAVLLLARSRFAVPAFFVSLIGLVLSNIYAMVNPMKGMADSAASYVALAVVASVMIALLFYAWRMRHRGILR